MKLHKFQFISEIMSVMGFLKMIIQARIIHVMQIDYRYVGIGEFRELWSAAVTSEEKNRALKKLVERIVYNREGNRVELTVCYR